MRREEIVGVLGRPTSVERSDLVYTREVTGPPGPASLSPGEGTYDWSELRITLARDRVVRVHVQRSNLR
jgi:hypothetical protein